MRQDKGQSVTQAPMVRASCLLAAALVCSLAMAQGIPEAGFRIMTSMGAGNCLACHALPNQRGVQSGVTSTLGPSLSQVGARYSPNELRQWVTDARQIKPDTLMPPFGTTNGTTAPNQAKPILNAEEIAHVVAALQTLR